MANEKINKNLKRFIDKAAHAGTLEEVSQLRQPGAFREQKMRPMIDSDTPPGAGDVMGIIMSALETSNPNLLKQIMEEHQIENKAAKLTEEEFGSPRKPVIPRTDEPSPAPKIQDVYSPSDKSLKEWLEKDIIDGEIKRMKSEWKREQRNPFEEAPRREGLREMMKQGIKKAGNQA